MWSVDLVRGSAPPTPEVYRISSRIVNMQQSLFRPEADTTDTIVMAALGTDAGSS